jgi:alpha-galactosidase
MSRQRVSEALGTWACEQAELKAARAWFVRAFRAPGAGPAEAAHGPYQTRHSELPFSFTLGRRVSAGILGALEPQVAEEQTPEGVRRRIAFSDPQTALEVICDAVIFDSFPACEWVLRFANAGAQDTPILEDVHALDLKATRSAQGEFVLHYAHGSTAGPTDFLPVERPLLPNSALTLAPNGGRSSNGVLPFFNIEWPGGGVVIGVGWSGQWEAAFARDAERGLAVRAGMQATHLVLRPGESIRTPRILLVFWRGNDRLRGHNLLRQLLLKHYAPRIGAEVAIPPVAANSYFLHNLGNDVTETNQLDFLRHLPALGVETYWLDAGWFEGGWPAGAGSWVPKANSFPRGLKALGDASHGAGMGFLVWFEPERVSPGTRIDREHPDWVLRTGQGGNGLFDLGNPEARAWLTDHLSRIIQESGIDIYRNDFNIDPLPYWRAADAPDRQGVTEVRYVEGLYEMWDEIRRRHPGLVIDNCASGGRRIDLETLSRSLPLSRSDTPCIGHPVPVNDQVQTAGLSLYVPLHASLCWGFDPYVFRSVMTTGTSLCMEVRASSFPMDAARKAIAELKRLRCYFLGDYYPLVPITLDEAHWCAWQFHRPDLDQGMALFLRRPNSPDSELEVSLRGLGAEARYRVRYEDTAECVVAAGRDLSPLRVGIPAAPGSCLITYAAIKQG